MKPPRAVAKMGIFSNRLSPSIMGPPASAKQASPVVQGNPNTGQPAHVSRKKSDIRFRSFAERWLCGRAHLISGDANKVAEDTYRHILDAKRAYAMVRSVGETITEDIEVE